MIIFFTRWPPSHRISQWFIVGEGYHHMFSGPGLIPDGLVQALYCDVSELAFAM